MVHGCVSPLTLQGMRRSHPALQMKVRSPPPQHHQSNQRQMSFFAEPSPLTNRPASHGQPGRGLLSSPGSYHQFTLPKSPISPRPTNRRPFSPDPPPPLSPRMPTHRQMSAPVHQPTGDNPPIRWAEALLGRIAHPFPHPRHTVIQPQAPWRSHRPPHILILQPTGTTSIQNSNAHIPKAPTSNFD